MSNMFRTDGAPEARQEVRTQNQDYEKRYAPITVGGYLGVFLLMLLPGINVVLLIVWACGGTKRQNLRNFARAALIILFFAVVLFLIGWIMFGNFWTRLIENLRYYW